MITTLEVILILTNIAILSIFFVSGGAIQLLINSELVWLFLYSLFAILAKKYDSSLLTATVLPVLIFAAVDCSVWTLLLVFVLKFTKATSANVNASATKFAIRTARVLLTNRRIN